MKIFDPKLTGSIEIQNTITGNVTIAGGLTVEGSLGGGITGSATASYVEYSNIANKPTLLSGSSQIASDISGSFTSLSSSLASELLKNTTDTLDGDLTVTGTITAQEFHTEFVSASIIYESGSTKFGDSSDDRHEFTGSTYLGRTYISDQVDVANNYSINLGSSRVHSSDTSYLMGGNVGINKTDPAALFDVEYKDTNHNLYRASDSSGMYRWRIDQFFNQYLTTAQGSDFIAFTNSGSYFNIGNVGIGNNNPLYPLHISSTSVYQAAIKSTGAQYLLIGSENASTAGIILDGDSNGDGAGGDYSYIVHENTGELKIVQDSPSGTNSLSFGTAGTENRVTINGSGYVGIGNTSPSAALTVGNYTSTHHQNHSSLPTVPGNHLVNLTPPSDTNYYGGGISWSEGTNTAASLGVYDAGGGGALGMYFATGNNTTLTERMRINSSGNLTVLNATSTNSRTIGITNAAGTTGWTFGNGVTANAHQFVIYDNTAGSARMVIDNDGLVVLKSMSANTTRNLVFEGDSNSTSGNAGAIGMFANGARLTSNYYYNGGQAKYVAGNGQAAINLQTGNTADGTFMSFAVNPPADAAGATERMRITSGGDINGPDRLYMRQTYMGYSSGYKAVQFGNSAATSIVSLGYNPSSNASGNFSGNEILIPNNVRILAPNAADNDFYGLMLLNSSNKLLIGSSNYLIDSNYIMLLDPATKNVNIGTAGPTSPGRVNIETSGATQVGVGLRLINPYGFASAGTGVQIVFAQDRSESENFEMAVIRSSQSIGGTSDNGDLKFFTRGSGTVGERMRILSSGGITFNGDSSSANALDDYEEGTYTPTVYTTSGTPTYNYQEGYYTKIGRQVFGGGIIGVTNSSSLGGTIEVSLPFTSRSSTYGTAGVTFADGSGFTWPVTTTNNSYSVYNMQAVIYQNQPKFSCVTITPSAGYIGYGSSGVSSTWYFRFGFNYAV